MFHIFIWIALSYQTGSVVSEILRLDRTLLAKTMYLYPRKFLREFADGPAGIVGSLRFPADNFPFVPHLLEVSLPAAVILDVKCPPRFFNGISSEEVVDSGVLRADGGEWVSFLHRGLPRCYSYRHSYYCTGICGEVKQILTIGPKGLSEGLRG